jgi:hypothetical protein
MSDGMEHKSLYDYWPTGAGAVIFAIADPLIILSIALYGSRPTKRLT